jgi:hypothetical protein
MSHKINALLSPEEWTKAATLGECRHGELNHPFSTCVRSFGRARGFFDAEAQIGSPRDCGYLHRS